MPCANWRNDHWLPKDAVVAIHAELINEHGGSHGTRDEALLESALSRPQNLAAYGEKPSLHNLAAAYAFGIARNHPFVDGNKRTALMAAYVFLHMNGVRLAAPEVDAVLTMTELAAGHLSETELAAWFKVNSSKKS